MTRRSLIDRAALKFDIADSGCWEWKAALDNNGYARFCFEGTTKRAHRVIYELVVEEIPEGLQLDHLCGNRACVNPDHLEPVSPAINTRRARAKDFCKYGHPFTPENRYYSGSKSTCRPCNIEWQRRKRGVA